MKVLVKVQFHGKAFHFKEWKYSYYNGDDDNNNRLSSLKQSILLTRENDIL